MRELLGKLWIRFTEFTPFSTEVDRYLLRFIVALLIAIPIVLFFFGHKDLLALLYKITLAIVGFTLADLIWAVSAPYFKRFEEATNAVIGVFIFRGLVYLGFILAVSHGL